MPRGSKLERRAIERHRNAFRPCRGVPLTASGGAQPGSRKPRSAPLPERIAPRMPVSSGEAERGGDTFRPRRRMPRSEEAREADQGPVSRSTSQHRTPACPGQTPLDPPMPPPVDPPIPAPVVICGTVLVGKKRPSGVAMKNPAAGCVPVPGALPPPEPGAGLDPDPPMPLSPEPDGMAPSSILIWPESPAWEEVVVPSVTE